MTTMRMMTIDASTVVVMMTRMMMMMIVSIAMNAEWVEKPDGKIRDAEGVKNA